MRREITHSLKCPNCSSTNMSSIISTASAREIRQGKLVCNSCNSTYAIHEGVAELLPTLDHATNTERTTRDSKTRDWETERHRPYINDIPDAPWVWPSFAANVEQGLAQVDLRGRYVLDIGAATGWSTRMIVEHGAQAVALDISTGMLVDAEAQFSNSLFFDRIAATMTNIPFANDTFDVLFASATIHHSGDLTSVFREISRVIKPFGEVVLVNEPVLGLLKNGDEFGQEDIAQGMNEHIYRLQDYLFAARNARLNPRVLFPEAINQQLTGLIPSPKSKISPLLRKAWPLMPNGVRKASLLPGLMLFGMPLTMVAKKIG